MPNSRQAAVTLSPSHAWQVLKKTRQLVPAAIKGGRVEARYTGYIPRLAVKKLIEHGWSPEQSRAMVERIIQLNFERFAASWQSYAQNEGVAADLLAMPDGDSERLLSAARLAELAPVLRQAQLAGVKILTRPDVLLKLAQHSAQFRETRPGSILCLILTEHYGLPPLLAQATLAYSKHLPRWVLVVIPVFVLIIAGMFWLALVNPNSSAFQTADFNGAGLVHYIVLPLFVLIFSWVWIMLLKDRPRREREWRGRFDAYQASLNRQRDSIRD